MKTPNKLTIILILFFGSLMFANSQTQPQSLATYSMPSEMIATCPLSPTEGNIAEGTVSFYKVKGGVRVMVEIKSLTPGKHGIHIHEFGDCSAPDAASAGGHFNPDKEPHAGPMDDMRHEGDFGNIIADENGNAHLDFIDTKLTLKGKNSIVGKSIIVHQGQDDLKSQPSGNSGPRIACGIISEGGC